MGWMDWMDGWARLAPWEIGMEKQRAMRKLGLDIAGRPRAPPRHFSFLVILAGLEMWFGL